ncbi:MAG: 50S ribosomal protein L25/general stress protein Ctc [Bacteroidales bacterium]|jgi:large subunit ribosomal protein L25|nr:50S ribosomal protein L25/general stress protein Ctc [Bacteroidales bacterium]
MKSVSMSGSLRENVGKKDAKNQRNNGFIPCVLYGGEKQLSLLIEEKSFKDLIYTPEVFYVELDVEGTVYEAIVQETQFHPVTDKLLHVDFLEIIEGKPITIEIPLRITGNSPGVMRGGKLSKRVRKLKIKGLLEHIPETITADISALDILDTIKVEDIKLENVAIIDNPAKVLITILSSRNVEEASKEETK